MIRVPFIHQNLPGQFHRSIRYVQTVSDDERVAIGEAAAVRRGQPMARVPVDLQQGGFDAAYGEAMPSPPAPALEETA